MALDRLPAAVDLMGLCDCLGIRFAVNGDGKPVLKCKHGAKAEALALSRLLRREPWRTQVIEAKRLTGKAPGPHIVVLKAGDDSEVEEVLDCEPTRENLRAACRERPGKQLAMEAPSVNDSAYWCRFGFMSWPRSDDPVYHPQPEKRP